MKPQHKILTKLFAWRGEEKGFKADIECKTVKGVKPDVRLTHWDYFCIHVELESVGTEYKYKLKREKTDKAHSILLYVDLRKFDLDSRTFNWIIEQVDFRIEQAMKKAEVPAVTIKYTENWPWLKKAKVGEEIVSPRRITKYRLLHSKIGKLGLIQIKINGTFEDKFLVRITDCKKKDKSVIQKNGRLLNEYNTSIFGHDRDDKGLICLGYFVIEEILKEEGK